MCLNLHFHLPTLKELTLSLDIVPANNGGMSITERSPQDLCCVAHPTCGHPDCASNLDQDITQDCRTGSPHVRLTSPRNDCPGLVFLNGHCHPGCIAIFRRTQRNNTWGILHGHKHSCLAVSSSHMFVSGLSQVKSIKKDIFINLLTGNWL